MDLKLGVWDGFVLPPLGLSAGAPAESRLEVVYYDTDDLRLLRRGVTARLRPAGNVWTCRWPGREVAPGSERELVELTRGWALGAPLAPVARQLTLRRTVALHDGERLVAVIDDDDVSVMQGERVAARFRELELGPAPDAPAGLLADLMRRLADAGAQPVDPAPKLARALGPDAVTPWPLDEAEPPLAQASAADVIRLRLMRSAAALADQHAAVLLDARAREARAAARALRRDLRLFRPLLDGAAPDLSRVSAALGRVRRFEILLDRVRAGAAEAPREAVEERLRAARGAAVEELAVSLRSDGYGALLAALAAFASAPPAAKAARRPAQEALPRLVRRPLDRLRAAEGRDVEALRAPATRLAVAVEAAAPYAGRDARRAAAALAELTDVLREHHRAMLAIRTLQRLARSSPDIAWDAGVLAGLETTRAEESRARLRAVWTQALRRKRWNWVP